MKSSTLNYTALCGDANQVVAASYFKLAQTYKHFNRNQEAE